MALYSAQMTATGAGTSVRPIFGVLSLTATSPILKEVALFNTTVTECTYKLVQLTGGTAGATVTARKHRRNGPPALCLAKQLWTVDATIGEDLGYVFPLGAAKGSGLVLPIDDVEGDVGSTAALGLIPVGTGQICIVKFTWEE